MEYRPDIYIPNQQNTARFALGMSGKKPLFLLGLNPSTANDQKADQTITRSMRFAMQNGYDGFVMLNIYAQRTPYPDQLHNRCNRQLHAENLKQIANQIDQYQQISFLAAWGSIISVRPYLINCLHDILELVDSQNSQWLQIGNLTKGGHPRHPSRAAYSQALKAFDSNAYLK